MKYQHVASWIAAFVLIGSVFHGDTPAHRVAGRGSEATVRPEGIRGGVVASSESVRITRWVAPRRGWLYVIDSNRGRPWSRILVVDPSSGEVTGEITAKRAVDMALSPDGKVAYVVSGDYLAAVGTERGSVLYESKVENREWSVILGVPSVAVAPDGRFVYLRRLKTQDSGTDENTIAVFDTDSHRLLSSDARVPDNLGILFPGTKAGQLDVLCYRIPLLRRLSFGADGSALHLGDLQVPQVDVERIRTMIKHPNDLAVTCVSSERGLAVVMASGAALEYDAETAKWRTLSRGGENRWLEPKTVLSQDRQVLYVGSNPVVRQGGRLNRGLGTDRIHAFDTRSWAEMRSLATSMAFWSLALDSAGKMLYAPTGVEGRFVLVIDLLAWREVGRLKDVGETPARVIVVR